MSTATMTDPVSPAPSTGRIVVASLVGTTIEFYDFYIYGTAAALVLGSMFFPHGASEAQSLAAFATFGIAFLARPIGAVLFGHFGDRMGRKSTLVASLATMGLSTTLIGVLPGYASAGMVAPILLCILRLGQGDRPWRRMGRRRTDRDGKCPFRAIRLVRHVPTARAGAWISVIQRAVSAAVRFSERCAVSDLGLAHSVPRQLRTRGDRPVCAPNIARNISFHPPGLGGNEGSGALWERSCATMASL